VLATARLLGREFATVQELNRYRKEPAAASDPACLAAAP